MGIFNRLSRTFSGESTPSRKAPAVIPEVAAAFGVVGSLAGDSSAQMDGYICVRVVGELFYQDALHELQWALDVLERIGHGFHRAVDSRTDESARLKRRWSLPMVQTPRRSDTSGPTSPATISRSCDRSKGKSSARPGSPVAPTKNRLSASFLTSPPWLR